MCTRAALELGHHPKGTEPLLIEGVFRLPAETGRPSYVSSTGESQKSKLLLFIFTKVFKKLDEKDAEIAALQRQVADLQQRRPWAGTRQPDGSVVFGTNGRSIRAPLRGGHRR